MELIIVKIIQLDEAFVLSKRLKNPRRISDNNRTRH